MIKHHPDENMLVEFSAGSLDWALGLSVSAHVSQCKICKAKLMACNGIGGRLLENVPKQEIDQSLIQNVLAKAMHIESKTEWVCAPTNKQQPQLNNISKEWDGLPSCVVKAINASSDAVRWRSVTPSLKTAQLMLQQDKYEVAFHKIKSGGTVAEHNHKGLEVTVVLEGSFSDENGVYGVGDFLVRQPGQVHRPTATQDQDCLCLSVLSAPVALTGFFGKFINPLMSFRPG